MRLVPLGSRLCYKVATLPRGRGQQCRSSPAASPRISSYFPASTVNHWYEDIRRPSTTIVNIPLMQLRCNYAQEPDVITRHRGNPITTSAVTGPGKVRLVFHCIW